MEPDKVRFRLYLVFFTALLVFGIFGFMVIENFSFVDSVYFSIVTMATVGYGDIHPQSAFGKILALVLIIGGVGTFLGLVAGITDIFLKRREEAFRRQKLHMVTGLFFSELGTDLLRQFALLDPGKSALYEILKISNKWTDKDFRNAGKRISDHSFTIESRHGDLAALREFLQARANFLLRMLENPILQEYGNFSDLLRATFHLRDELLNRTDLSILPDMDRQHLEGDIARIYKLLVPEWLAHMNYLKDHYGYLLSLAMRVNPFNPEASAVVLDTRN
jgi:voltage-gated potassium channel